VTLTFELWPVDLKFTPLVTLVQSYVSTKLDVSAAFSFRENRRHERDGRTDGRGATLSAASIDLQRARSKSDIANLVKVINCLLLTRCKSIEDLCCRVYSCNRQHPTHNPVVQPWIRPFTLYNRLCQRCCIPTALYNRLQSVNALLGTRRPVSV